MTSPDEIVNAVTYLVGFSGLLVIVVLTRMFITRYKLYKLNKYVKEATEREKAEKAKEAGRFHVGRGKW